MAAPAELAESAAKAEPESAGARSAPAAEPKGTEPDTAGLKGIGARDSRPREAGRPFDSVLLLTEENRERPADGRPPLPMGADQQHEMGRLFSLPLILAVYCSNGHVDDLSPILGGLRDLDEPADLRGPGAVWPAGPRRRGRLPMGTDYMIGREPTLDAAAVGKARPLRVDDDSGTVSRVHVRIGLDGWQVLVADLGSPNGSRFQLLDQGCEQQLTPCMPVLLLPGSHGDVEPGSTVSPTAAAEAHEPALALGSGAR